MWGQFIELINVLNKFSYILKIYDKNLKLAIITEFNYNGQKLNQYAKITNQNLPNISTSEIYWLSNLDCTYLTTYHLKIKHRIKEILNKQILLKLITIYLSGQINDIPPSDCITNQNEFRRF